MTAEEVIQVMLDKHQSLVNLLQELNRREQALQEEIKLVEHEIGMLRGLIRRAGGKVEGI